MNDTGYCLDCGHAVDVRKTVWRGLIISLCDECYFNLQEEIRREEDIWP